MILGVQIVSLIFSFFYGIIFYFVGYILKRFLFNKNIIVALVCSFLFMLFFSTIYFIFLWYLNSGIVHLYFLFMFIVGFISVQFLINCVKIK